MPRLTDYVDMDKKFDALRAEIERLTRDLAEADQYNETARRVAAEQSAEIERLTAENERLRIELESAKQTDHAPAPPGKTRRA